jgi:NAD+ kinase
MIKSIIIGLIANESKPAARESARRLVATLASPNLIFRITEDLLPVTPKPGVKVEVVDVTEVAQSNFVVVFGGDGTLLAASRLVAPYQTPLLSVHMGHFGFVTEVAPENMLRAVDMVIEGEAEVQERLLLQGTLTRQSAPGTQETFLALNDVVVANRTVRLVQVRTEIGHTKGTSIAFDVLATYAADGVIVASPTGSTGYSLSAGGPLVHPSSPVLIITPIAAHTLSARSLVIPDTEVVRLTIEGEEGDNPKETFVSADGQKEWAMEVGDSVQIRRADHMARLLSVGGPSFYQKIRSRWHYGERVLPRSAP